LRAEISAYWNPSHGSNRKSSQQPGNALAQELDKALTLSADRARRMAEAFGLKVPGVAPKREKASGSAATPRRVQKA
jgi:hypothetical protein